MIVALGNTLHLWTCTKRVPTCLAGIASFRIILAILQFRVAFFGFLASLSATTEFQKDPMQTAAELVKRARGGDAAAIRLLVERYEQTVLVTAWAIVGDYHLAQDVAQESFVAAFRSLRQLQQEEAFGPWLLAITRRNAQRESKRRPQVVEGLPLASIAATETDSMTDYEDLLPMLEKLPEHERDVVCLRFISGLSIRQVADELQRSVGTVTKQLSRAIERLRALAMGVER